MSGPGPAAIVVIDEAATPEHSLDLDDEDHAEEGDKQSVPRVVTSPRRCTRALDPPASCKAAWVSTLAELRRENVHLHDGVSEGEFVAMRIAPDNTLGMPTLIASVH
ncbi:beta-lactamase domain-containing protein [Caballeronia choica]|jgi:hypothetical protein|uniref:Beta-lactamase domain-containing protein n=1 Tax=Caballeronia choica TaxID=326476 RepID=A0A158FDC7_9BURK|nr:hypothetical protein [Caballeronia choica]SAL17804.1 beta-lactamase domain-containing protein [Caballeronia choica]